MLIIFLLSLIIIPSLILSLFMVYDLNKLIKQKNIQIIEKDAQIQAMKISLGQYSRKLDEYEDRHCLHHED